MFFSLAMEAQAFSLDLPELLFSIFSPPRNDTLYRAARDRLEEDIRFASKVVRWSFIHTTAHTFIHRD